MTTAIEQAKREMYKYLADMKSTAANGFIPNYSIRMLETTMEAYLEQLRQQYEEMASTAHQRFESIRSLEAANQDLIASLENFKAYNSRQADTIGRADDEIADLESRLAKMTESRDMFRNLHQASTHAAIESYAEPSTPHQDSGDRASCEQPDAKTMAILGAVLDCQQIVTDWACYGHRARKQMKKIASVLNDNLKLSNAMLEFENQTGSYGSWFIANDKCMHSFFAIGDDQFKCTFCGVGK